MSRWTDLQKEWQGYRRKLAYGKQEVSLKEAPWEKEDESTRNSTGRNDKRTKKEVRKGTG